MKTTKKQMIELLIANGIDVNGLKLSEIKEIYNGLLIKNKPLEVEQQQEEVEQQQEEVEQQQEEVEQQQEEVEQQQEEVTSFSDLEELERKISESEVTNEGGNKPPLIEKTNKKRGKKESNPESFRVQGYVLLLVCDTIFPFLLSFVHNNFEKRFRISSNQLALTPEQFKNLEPLADQASDYMNVNINPVYGFFIVSGFMYANNMLTLRESIISELPKEQQIKRKVKK